VGAVGRLVRLPVEGDGSGPVTTKTLTGAEGRAVSPHSLDGKQEDPRTPGVQPPEVNLHLDVRFRAARMRIALIAGVRPNENCRRWTVVARDGTHTSVLEAARLYPFTRAGRDAAVADAQCLAAQLSCGDGWKDFVWRVLVEGPWERPEAVTPVWVVERLGRPESGGPIRGGWQHVGSREEPGVGITVVAFQADRRAPALAHCVAIPVR